jgi:predicted metal-dependent phosphotriesterase family hydrolase
MVGCGYYADKSQPSWLTNASVDDVSAFVTRHVDEGIADTEMWPALIGGIGTSDL